MISRDFFDITTLLIYISVSVISSYFLKKAAKVSHNNKNQLNRWYILLIFFLTLFATFRCIGSRIGGTDALNYINEFENASTLDKLLASYNTSVSEIFFVFYTFIIRQITSNYHVYFLITYFVISFSYVCFIIKYSDEINSPIPYVILTFFYLKTFSSLRTGLAVAIFLWAIIFIKRRFTSILLAIIAVLVHRATIFYALFIFFYKILKKIFEKKSGKQLFIMCGVLSFVLILVANFFRNYILQFSFLNSTDLYYITHGSSENVFSRWIMFFPQILLLILFLIFKNSESDEKIEVIKLCVIFDIIMIPLALSLGLYRANEYMFLPRLVLWGYYISLIEKKYIYKTKANINIYRLIMFVIFISWFLFRLTNEWYDLGLMFYRFRLWE